MRGNAKAKGPGRPREGETCVTVKELNLKCHIDIMDVW